MAARAFINSQLSSAHDPIRVPNVAKVTSTSAYALPPEHWGDAARAVYDHYQPSIPQKPPLTALEGDNYRKQESNMYAGESQQQQQKRVNSSGVNSHPSTNVSTLKHNDSNGVNVIPTRAGAVDATHRLTSSGGTTARPIISDITNASQSITNRQQQNTGGYPSASSYNKSPIPSPTAHHIHNGNLSSSPTSSLPAPSPAAANAAVQHLLSQIQFLHKEVERLEGELAASRSDHAEVLRRLFDRKGGTGGSYSLNASHDLSTLADGSAANSASASASAAAILGPAAATRRLHEHQLQMAASEAQQLSQRCRNLEAQLAASNAAKKVAIDEKVELGNKIRKLEAALKAKKSSFAEVEESLTAKTTQSTDEAVKLRARLEETQKEFVRLAKHLDRANEDLQRELKEKADLKSRLVSSFAQCGGDPEETAEDFTPSGRKKAHDVAVITESPRRLDACCQVDTTMTRLYGLEGVSSASPLSNTAAQASTTATPFDQNGASPNKNDLLFMMGIAGGSGVGGDDVLNQVRGAVEVINGADGGNYSVPAAAASAVGALNYNNMAHLLQVRCAELDTARGDLHRITEVHKETLQYLEVTKKRLASELDRRKVLESDNEKLALQVRALQQQGSLLSSQLREKDELIERFQRDAQNAISSALKMEQERAGWETELSANAKDMQNLLTNQNFMHQQLASVQTENDELKKEVQRLLQLESTNQMAYRAKESELSEVLQAYQLAVREGEANVAKFKGIERESENLRAQLSVKEERVVHLQEQVANLHAREQQLTLDLQSFDYEGGQLHRKLIAADQAISQLNAQIHDLQQHGLAFQRIQHELDASQAELSKRLVIRDQECMHLRMRCDQLEQECTALSTARLAESNRLRELEDLNAQQRVREVLFKNASAASNEQQLQTVNKELENVRSRLREKEVALAKAQREADDERIRTEQYMMHLKEVEHLAAVAEGERQRLQNLVEEQASTLEKLSQ